MAEKKVVKAKKAAPKKSAPAAKKATANPSTEFSVYAPDAKEVFLAGEFNGWACDSKEFRMRRFKDGTWKKKVTLKPGRYEYQFVVDGNWWADPVNTERVPSPFCSENSVQTVL